MPTTRSLPLPEAVDATAHEHAWATASAHATSEGVVRYVSCPCGARRVDLQPYGAVVPAPLSGVVAPRA
ncbi:hypothetical protein [Microbacterium indicum]|uniref:hypothetical protein n=1 Tax=Microbacterium indicum TaxID=358100 RepID=UPI000407AA1F|nr:hypothetical protein [Microbacterium indicum]